MADFPRGWLADGLERAAAERQGLIEALGLAGQERDKARRERDAARRERFDLLLKEERDAAALLTAQVSELRGRADRLEKARDEARKERDALRTELRAREWLDEQDIGVGIGIGLIFVGIDDVAFAYASYAAAARAYGWEG